MSAKAMLHVKNLAFCEIEIEADRIPPSLNMIDYIEMLDGFGMSLPVLQMRLFDQNNNLTSQLALNDATKISITVAKEDTIAIKRTFRVFGYKREKIIDGPSVLVAAILDAPKWSAGVYREAFAMQTSVNAISSMASKAGLKFEGPLGPTVDVMNWLNINQTRSSFAEDVAMRGYANPGSCMSKIVTMDGVVKYKDIIKELLLPPQASFLMNTHNSEATSEPIPVRESENQSSSGIVTHWFNYGYKQYEHSLTGHQMSSESLQAPVLGSGLPINSDVKGMLDGSRVSYVGFDSGTAPEPAFNVHTFYERAYYQNLRYLGLFSERIRVLTDMYTSVSAFQCAEYKQSDADGSKLTPNAALSGKYLVGGKAIRIKNGHWYHEVFDLYRPFIEVAGSSPSVSATSVPSATTANDGSIPIPSAPTVSATSVPSGAVDTSTSTVNAASNKATPSVKQAQALMDSLKDYNKINPAVPTTPLPPAGTTVPPSTKQVQNDIRKNAQALKQGPLSEAFDNATPQTLENHATIKKISAEGVTKSMQASTGTLDASEVPKHQTLAIERFSDSGATQMKVPVSSVVSTDTSSNFSSGDKIGDVASGGYEQSDILNSGTTIPDVVSTDDIITDNQKTVNAGTSFVQSPASAGVDAKDISFKPAPVAAFFKDMGTNTDPQEFLAQKGAEDYIKTFGAVTPDEAQGDLDTLAEKASDVESMYGSGEVLTDSKQSNAALTDQGTDLALEYGDPDMVPTVNVVKDVTPYAVDGVTPGFKDSVKVIESVREMTDWSEFFGYGSDKAQKTNSDAAWDWPFDFPQNKPSLDDAKFDGDKLAPSDSMLSWSNKEADSQIDTKFDNLFET